MLRVHARPQLRLIAAGASVFICLAARPEAGGAAGTGSSVQTEAEQALAKLRPDADFVGPVASLNEFDSTASLPDTTRSGREEQVLWWRERGDTGRSAAATTVRTKSGTVTFLTLFSHSGTAKAIVILSTTGKVNARLRSPFWRRKIRRLQNVDKLVPGRNIDGVSGATLSVGAMCDAINRMAKQPRRRAASREDR